MKYLFAFLIELVGKMFAAVIKHIIVVITFIFGLMLANSLEKFKVSKVLDQFVDVVFSSFH